MVYIVGLRARAIRLSLNGDGAEPGEMVYSSERWLLFQETRVRVTQPHGGP